MRYLLHQDVIRLSLEDDKTFHFIVNLAQEHYVYIAAYDFASIVEGFQIQGQSQQLKNLQSLLSTIKIVKTPSYIDTTNLLKSKNIAQEISKIAANSVAAIIVTAIDDFVAVNKISLVEIMSETGVCKKVYLNIPFINLKDQFYSLQSEIEQSIDETLQSSEFIMGDKLIELEQKLCQFTSAKYAFACASGSDALLLALLAIDCKAGDEIIVPAFSFVATASMPALLGARIKFVDILDSSFNLDYTKIEEQITLQTLAIIPVSLYGQVANMDEINHIAHEHGNKLGKKIFVIEDAAQSLGATYKNSNSCNLSELAITSFFPAKPLGAYGDAGAIFTNNSSLAKKIIALRIHGQSERYKHNFISINARCDTIQAAVLTVKLRYFAQEIQQRQKLAAIYTDNLSHLSLELPKINSFCASSWAQYSIRVSERQDFIDYLTAANIPTAIHYPIALHLQPCFSIFNYGAGDFAVAEKISTEIVSLPFSSYLDVDHQDYIISTINSYFAQKKSFSRDV